MAALPKHRMNVTEFFAWEELQEGDARFELVNGEVISMSPERARHVQVKARAWLALRNAVEKSGSGCAVFMDGMTVVINEHTAREPDVSIQCKPVDSETTFLDEPIAVVEVISPSSTRSDTGAKVAEYLSVPSIRHYVIIDPYASVLIHHERDSDGGSIKTSIVASGDLALSQLGISVPVAELLFAGGEKS